MLYVSCNIKNAIRGYESSHQSYDGYDRQRCRYFWHHCDNGMFFLQWFFYKELPEIDTQMAADISGFVITCLYTAVGHCYQIHHTVQRFHQGIVFLFQTLIRRGEKLA
jgi:hypothetical protein